MTKVFFAMPAESLSFVDRENNTLQIQLYALKMLGKISLCDWRSDGKDLVYIGNGRHVLGVDNLICVTSNFSSATKLRQRFRNTRTYTVSISDSPLKAALSLVVRSSVFSSSLYICSISTLL